MFEGTAWLSVFNSESIFLQTFIIKFPGDEIGFSEQAIYSMEKQLPSTTTLRSARKSSSAFCSPKHNV